MRTASEYLRANPHARSTTIAHREKVAATVEQLQREIAAKGMDEVLRDQKARTPRPWWERRLTWWERLFS